MTAQVRKRLRAGAGRRFGESAAAVAVRAGAFLAAFLAARAPVLAQLYPLGIAAAGAAPSAWALPVCAGAALGYAAGVPVGQSAPYLAAVLAVAAARAVCTPRRRSVPPLTPAVFGALCYALCACGMALVTGAGVPAMLLAVSESLMASGAAYLLAAFWSMRTRRISQGDREAAAASLFALMTAVIACTPLRVGALSLGVLLAALAALAAALYAGEDMGAAAGVAVCAALAASDAALLFAGFGIAAGAVTAGLCRDSARSAAGPAFVIAASLGAACAPSAEEGVIFLLEACAAALAVHVVPAKLWSSLSPPASAAARPQALEASARLDDVARALCSVGETMAAVCGRMPKAGEGFDEVCEAATRRVCAKCRRNAECWTGSSPDAFDAFNALAPKLRASGGVTAADLPAAFRAACAAPDRVCAAVTGAYQAQLARRKAALRTDAARSALVEQYGALASAVGHLANSVYREELPDRRRAARLEELFTELGTPAIEVSVSADASGAVHAVVRLPRSEFTARELRALTAEVSAVCRCPFETAAVRAAGEQTVLTFRRRRCFDAVFGCSARAAEDVSADVFRTAEDGRGSVHAILCDGMGTGRAAAVDGTLTAALLEPLLCAGTGAEAAARLAGVALSLKGGGEELAAVDVLSVDLYTGRARLYKAGGAPSFLIRAGEVTRLGGESLPIGGYGRVTGRTESLELCEGDKLLLVSDGVTAPGEDALEALLAHKTRLSAQELCEAVVAAVSDPKSRPDDVTAACLELRPLVRAV